MAHRFEKSVADYACGMVVLLTSRIEEHQNANGGKLPRQFVLHSEGAAALRDESYKRFGRAEGMTFMGIQYTICPCNDAVRHDLMVDWRGFAEIL